MALFVEIQQLVPQIASCKPLFLTHTCYNCKPFVNSYFLPRIPHPFPQHRAEDHLNVLDEGVVVEVVEIDAHLIRIYDVVVIPHRQLLIRHLINILRKIFHKIFFRFLAKRSLTFHF